MKQASKKSAVIDKKILVHVREHILPQEPRTIRVKFTPLPRREPRTIRVKVRTEKIEVPIPRVKVRTAKIEVRIPRVRTETKKITAVGYLQK
jgi:hypothetical protein